MGASTGPKEGGEHGLAARLVYREDDGSFKRRLNTAIQMSWVYSTAIIIMLTLGIFSVLGLNLPLGLILGILFALMANLPLTITRVTQASRWEVYKNRVVIPLGLGGRYRTVHFSDIARFHRGGAFLSETFIIELGSGERLVVDASENEGVISALELAFRQHRRSKGAEIESIVLPVRTSPTAPLDATGRKEDHS